LPDQAILALRGKITFCTSSESDGMSITGTMELLDACVLPWNSFLVSVPDAMSMSRSCGEDRTDAIDGGRGAEGVDARNPCSTSDCELSSKGGLVDLSDMSMSMA
jgi:hypothetical protein